ncbi:hypothetical protein ACVNP1_07090 [Staphylococcus aureus]
MAMYEVKKKNLYRLEKGQYLKSGKRVELIKRAEYVNKKSSEHGVILERVKEE